MRIVLLRSQVSIHGYAGAGTITAIEGTMRVHSGKVQVPMVKAMGATEDLSGYK